MRNAIFVSYRNHDEPFAALLIDWCLAQRFGRGQIFRDGRTIPPGTHFPDEISRALQQCRVLVAVIGQRWLCRGPAGQRMIDDPSDYVRYEIAVALQRDILVVPVLVGDALLPVAAALPADIAGLTSRQYLHLRVRTAENDASRLVDALTGLLDGGCSPARQGAAASQPGAAAVSHDIHGPVDARHSILGNVYYGG